MIVSTEVDGRCGRVGLGSPDPEIAKGQSHDQEKKRTKPNREIQITRNNGRNRQKFDELDRTSNKIGKFIKLSDGTENKMHWTEPVYKK